MIEAVGEHGYQETKVTELASRSGVSTRSFYDLFSGKDECLLATYEMVLESLTKSIVHAQAGQRDWDLGVRSAFEVLTKRLAEEPAAARLALVEIFAAGPQALELMHRTVVSLEELILVICERSPVPRKPPRLVVKGVVAGLIRVARSYVLEDRLHELPAAADELIEWTLCYESPAAQVLESPELATASLPKPPRRRGGRCSDVDEDDPREGRNDGAHVLEAALMIAGRSGVDHVTFANLAFESGVGKRRIHELVDDCDSCLLRAFELAWAKALGEGVQAAEEGSDWADGLLRTIEVFLSLIVSDPVLAEVACVGVLRLGRVGLECREALLSGLEQALMRTAPHGLRPSKVVAAASVGAAWGIVNGCVANDAGIPIPVLAGGLSYMLLTPVIGPEAAAETIKLELRRLH